jgi:hypothetical protein
MDTQSLAALLELQQSIATGKLDADRAMHLVVDRARSIANATGVAIALLNRDQLLYRAGSGCAASYVGRHITAILSVSAHNEARGEILRVENAQTDGRIEAAICRQFEAQALLILPIYHQRALAGVLEVLFGEAHAFQEQEVRTYRLMTGLVEEAMLRDVQRDQNKQPTTVPHAIEQITSHMQPLRHNDRLAPEPASEPWIGRVFWAVTGGAGKLPGLGQPAKAATTIIEPVIKQRRTGLLLHTLRLHLAVTGVIAMLVLVAGWIVYAHRPASPSPRGTSSLQGPPLQAPNAARQAIPFVAYKPAPSNRASKKRTAAGGTEDAEAPSSAFKRVRIGPNEVDYVTEDVTTRRFTTKPAPLQLRQGYKEVHYGDDVTVRYFASNPAVVPKTRPVSAAAQSVERSLPKSK